MTAYRFDDFVLDVAKRELARAGGPVRLSPRAFDCLVHLLGHRDRDVGRDELVAAVFGRTDVSDAQLGQIVLRARRAVGDDGQGQRRIRTVPRYGFRWVGEAETLVDAPADMVGPVPTAPGASATTRAPAARSRPPHAEARRARGWPVALLVSGMAAVVVLAARPLLRAPPAAAEAAAAASRGTAVVVLPSRIDGPDDMQWARMGLMDYLADRLRRAGLPVPPSETTLRLADRAGAGAGAATDLRRLADAELLVGSRATYRDTRWRVELTAVAADGIAQRGRAEHADLISAARNACDRLLSALGRTPPADGEHAPPDLQERLLRAQAATLANELDAARAILRAAPELQRQAPQLRYRLAQVDFHAGLYERSLAELDALLAQAGSGDPLFRGNLLNARGANRIRLDRYHEAQSDFEAAVALLDPQRHPVEAGKALNGRGVARLVLGDFEGASADLGRARILLMRIGDAVGAARVDANLGHLERRRDHPHQALAHFVSATRAFESLGAINELASTRAMVVDAHLQLLQNDQAAQASERALAMRPRIGDVAQRAMVDLDHARVLLRLGRLREAAGLLAAPAADSRPNDFLRGLAALLRVELALQAGRAGPAVRLADAALAQWPAAAEPIRGWMLLRREQAALAAELPGLAAGQTVAGGEPSLPDALVRAIALQRGGDEAAAHQAYRQALLEADRAGAPHDLVEVANAYLPWLIEQGHLAEAAELAGRVAPWASYDFDAAVLQLRIHHASGQREAWQAARQDVRRLAGERTIAPFLLLPPVAESTQAHDPDAILIDAMK
ncbi:winged helix-turn-helix domain-containing protein [Luteimonas sp. R10]|uniref:winged helix-turn-helix domain-containing protein n=1 Tax=Luteimonas sp. R10 TaxID=3108176 RepID=UPI0030855E9A|nr:winged helix-turn-helix domain-containing protein [Luteimonas sp. R10]